MTKRGGDPVNLSMPLGSVAGRLGLGDMMRRIVIWKRWEETVGEKVAAMAWPKTFRDRDILVVAVADSAWMHHMSYLKPDILSRLNACLKGGALLSDMRFVIDDIAKVRMETAIRDDAREKTGESAGALPADQIRRAEELAAQTSDPGLGRLIRDLYLSNASRHIIKDNR